MRNYPEGHQKLEIGQLCLIHKDDSEDVWDYVQRGMAGKLCRVSRNFPLRDFEAYYVIIVSTGEETSFFSCDLRKI